MKHIIRTYNKDHKCVYENHHQTAESAYEEYINNIRTICGQLCSQTTSEH